MAKLYFKVASDWEEVVKLRNEIAKLKQELKGMDSTQSPTAFKTLNTQLSASTQKMDELVNEAAKAGAVMEGDFKKKIFDASQTVNGLTEKIIAQKAVVKDIEADVKRLGDAYRTALKRNPLSASGKLEEYNAARKALDEEKAALFGLTQEQANARLSVKKLRDEYSLYKNDGKQVVETNQKIGLSLGKALGVIGGVTALKQLGSEIVRVRGEFQSMQTAIETLVGKDMAGQLIPQIKEMAKVSPLTLTDFVSAEKMMLGFNIESEKTIRYLQALSDISMGNSQKFNSLTLAFSQMSAAGKLMGQDLNQMINAGFNPLQMISEKTGKSISVLKDEMSKGAISAEMVQQAFVDATNAGGKFYQMSENASKTINGQLSMMQDAMDAAFNEMGQKSEGVIMSGIQLTTSLIENYETIGKVLVGMIATYGVYKTALITNIALTRGWAVAARADAAAKGIQTIATKAQTVAQLALNAAMKANPYVLAATLIVGVATAMWAFHDSATAAEKAQRKFNDEQERFISKEEERKRKIEDLIRIIQDETETEYAKIKVYEELQRYSPALVAAYNREQLAVLSLAGSQKVLNAERDKINYDEIISQVNKYTEYVKRLSKNGDKLANVGDLFSAITGEYGLNTSWKERLNLAEEDLKKWQNALDEYNRLKKQAEEDAKPVEVKLLEAKSSRDQIIQEYNAAKIALEQEQEKLKNSPFAVIPIDVQIRFDNAQSALKDIDSTINNLQSKKSEIKNKSYWETKKKEAETARDVLDVSEKNSKKWNEYTKQIQEAEKQIAKYSSPTKQESQAEKLRKQTDKYNLLLDKQVLEQKRSAEDLQMKVDEARIKAMDEGSAKTIAEMELNFEKEMQAIDRQKEDALRKKIEDARSAWEANPGNKGKSFDATGIELSDSEQKYFDELYKSAIAVNEKTKLRSEADAMRDYLKEYGTFQQQKLAIAEEYADKIEKAATKGERLSLEKQRDSAIQQVDIKALEQKIDWQAVFGDISGILGSQLKETLEGLKEYVKTDKFNSSSETDKQIVYDAIDRLSEVTPGGEGTLNFSKIKAQMDSLGASISKYQAATIAQTLAQDNLKKATDNYNNALKGGSSEQIENAKVGLSMAQNAAKIADDAYNSAASDVRNLGEEYKSTSADTIDGLNLVAAGFQGFANKSLPSIFSGLQSTLTGLSKLNIGGAVGDAIGKLSQTLSSAGVIGQIISAILSILDILKDGIGPLISGIIDSILGAINGILDNILSGDMFVQIFSSIKNGIGNILNTISFGGFNSLFGIGGNKKEVEEAINRLTDRNETLQTAIEDLTDVMEASKGTKSVAAYTDAKKLQKETEDNYKKIAQEQARYSGSHHSWNYYWGGFNQEETSRLSNQIGRNWNGDIWSLSPEEMKMLRSNVDMWEKIQSAGKGGYGERLTEKLDAYIDQAGKMEELTDKLYEGLTGISFDSMYDSFIDTLMDMDASAEDSANKISEYFMRAMLSNKIGELYSDKLEEWWKKFGASMEDNELTETEREALQDEYMGYVEEAMKLRDELAAATGYDKISQESTSQSATSRGFGTEMTHEDAGELSGRFTALQIAGEEIKNQNIVQSQSLNLLTAKTDAILSVNTETRNIADDTRDLIANSYLELVQISENTGNSAKYLKDIKADIAEVKKNTSKL